MAMPKRDFEIVKDLQSIGLSEEWAQGIVRAIYDIYVANVATKSDLADLRAEVVETREALRSEIAQKLVETKESLRKEMSDIQTSLIKWMIGTALGSVALVTAILGIVIPQLIK